MFSRHGNKLLVIICLVFLIASAATSRPRKTQRVQPSIWGGVHIRIDVGSGAATVEFDCASGRIDGPFSLDSKGRFSWRGAFARGRGGPIRLNEKSNERPAIYSGSIKDDTMTLTIKLADSDKEIATYTLKRGSEGRIRRCG